jgi:hypothetical protein
MNKGRRVRPFRVYAGGDVLSYGYVLRSGVLCDWKREAETSVICFDCAWILGLNMDRIGRFKMLFEYFPEKFAVTKGRFGPVSDAGKHDFEA